ncbi:MAG: hypothetical protein IH888_08860 [Planctomycetes bacterium]|nr:hypothetical protein [Planctomycetota bacterium]
MRIATTFVLMLLVATCPARAGWTEQNSGVTDRLRDVHFPVDDQTGYVVGNNGVILKTTNGGATWSDVSDPLNIQTLFSVHFTNNSTGHAVGANVTILRTSNGGTSWTATTLPPGVHFYGVRFPDTLTGYIVGGSGTILKTIDGGDNWTDISDPAHPTTTYFDVDFVDTQTGYIAGNGDVVLKTTNGGTSWTNVVDAPNMGTLQAIDFTDASTGYLVEVTGKIHKTTNGGTSWTFPNEEPILYDVHFPTASAGYATGSSSTILQTTDGGATWVERYLPVSPNALFRGVHFPAGDASTGYVVGDGGMIFKTTDGGDGSQIALHPKGNGSVSDFPSSTGCGSTNHWDCVNDQVGNAGTGMPRGSGMAATETYIRDNNGQTNRDMFSLDDGVSLPGQTVTGIDVRAQIAKGSGPAKYVSLSYQRMGTDDFPIDGPSTLVTESTCCWQFLHASWTGLNWTDADIDALEIGIKHNSGGVVDISQIFVVLTYGVGGEPQMATGTYTGNGTAGTQITVGFAPDVVIVKTSDGSTNRMAYIRTSTMTGDVSKKLNQANQFPQPNMIQKLDDNGFTVGSHAHVNADGLDYYWIAFNAWAGELKVDTYLGNGTNDTSIGGVGFQPDYLIVFGEGSTQPWQKSSSMPATKSSKFGPYGLYNNVIKAFEADGFQVSASTGVNADGVTYHYVAWKAVAGRMAVGQYTGNGGATQSIASVGFQPQYVIVKADAAITPVHRPESLVGDWTLHFVGLGKVGDGIQALQTNGFRVGSIAEVNQNTTIYHWMAFGRLPPPTLSHQWVMDETSGTTAADSISSSDGTLVNFPFDDSQWSCLNGGSLDFDGVDDYVSLPTESDYDFTNAVTVAAWINVTSFSVAEQAIVTKGDTAWRLERNASTNTLQFSVDGLTTNTLVQGSVSVNDGTWHHVAGVYDGAQLLLYVDGQLDTAVTATGTMDTNSSAVYFGANADVAGRYFNGLMDDVYIYDTALSASAIQTLAQKSLLGWWKLNETSGTTANDISAYSNDGTLTNMVGTEWTAGRDYGGLDFEGTLDYIETNVASDLATSNTMMTWFKSDDAGSIGNDDVAQRFITQRRGSTSSRLALGLNNDRVAVYWHDGASVVQEATTTVTTSRWYHAAVTYDGTTVRLYINGVEDGNWPEASMSAPSADTHQIAVEGFVRYFDGVLDDVRLHSRALCAAEISAIHEQTRAPRILLWREVDPY